MQVNPYLHFNGDCAEAFKFYEENRIGKLDGMMAHAGTPAEKHVPAEWRDKILHARLLVGDGVVMASDAPPGHYHKPQGFSVSLHLTDVAEGERIFKVLAEGGTVHMPFAETFWAAAFGMCTDRFGIPWIVNCERPHEH